MNIFIISRGYPTKQEPTWGCFEKDQAKALVEYGHHVVMLSVDTRFRWYWRPLGIQYKMEDGVAIYNVFLLPYALLFFLPKRFKALFYSVQLEWVFERACKNYGMPNILYAHYLQNTQKAIYIHQKYNIPLVAIEHWSQMAFQPIPKESLQLGKETYPLIDQLLTVSSSLQNNIYNQIGVTSIVVPNIVGKEFYLQNRNNIKKTSKIQIVSIGRLVKLKRFDMLIKALARVQQPFNLTIIGAGEERKNLENLISQLHLEQNIQLVGMKSKQEIVSILQESDLFILPSQSETFGVVYIEALACGLPIIATDCGGPKDIVNENNGLLVPINDIEALFQAIDYMLRNIHKYDKQMIAADCQKRFSSEVIGILLTKIFEDILRKNSK